ncbi:MAG: NUDIX hydrolase [Candidatus Thermoplasmatota archaeon]
MKIEKPDEDELEELYQKFGEPEIKEEKVSLTNLEYTGDYPDCKGEAVLLISKEDKIVGVRHHRSEKFVLPMGRVWESEDFVEGAKREGKEETGLDIEINSLDEIRKVRYDFSNDELERWDLLFGCEVVEGKPQPEDEEEIAEAELFYAEWYWNKGFYIIRETKER